MDHDVINPEVQALRNRWSSDLVIQVVIALNRGEPLYPAIQRCPECNAGATEKPFDLRGIDLSFQNLRGPWHETGSGRQRTGVKLSDCDLSYANLNWTILLRADLSNTLLVGADMRDCELILADCSGADFTGAAMQNAWMLDTLLKNAVISRNQLKARRNIGQMDFDIHAYEI